MEQANRSYICGKEEENCNPLLLHYGSSRAVWHLLISLLGVYWVYLIWLKICSLEWFFSGQTQKQKKSVAENFLMPFLGEFGRKRKELLKATKILFLGFHFYTIFGHTVFCFLIQGPFLLQILWRGQGRDEGSQLVVCLVLVVYFRTFFFALFSSMYLLYLQKKMAHLYLMRASNADMGTTTEVVTSQNLSMLRRAAHLYESVIGSIFLHFVRTSS